MKILVTGGAGYIGSHTVDQLISQGHHVVVIDNLSNGHREFVPPNVEFFQADLSNTSTLNSIFSRHQFDAVVHFAAFIEAGESMKLPEKYFANNTTNTLSLLTTMIQHNVRQFVFSSTAAIFGEPVYTPIDENHPKNPTNYYGTSKLMVEMMLESFSKVHNLRYVSLRYFNAAGADPSGTKGEKHNPETHLIPLVIQAAQGKRPSINIFGTDYPTKDGTCVRDYIHVSDLASAHLLALQYLQRGGESNCFNLGNQQGFSVKEIIHKVKEITDTNFPITHAPRREGDPATLIASSQKIQNQLGWQPQYSLHDIIEHAVRWHSK